MTPDAVRRFLRDEFPAVFADGGVEVVAAAAGRATLRLVPDARHLRPGGIVAGPTLALLADTAAYAALLSLDAAARTAVTATLTVSFLRAARPGAAITQEARVVKAGRRLATALCEAYDGDTLLAHATLTYAMGPEWPGMPIPPSQVVDSEGEKRSA